MPSFIKVVFSLYIVTCVAGCTHPLRTWEQNRAEKIYELEKYSFDLASSNEQAELIIYCIPPSQQLRISDYVIEIDDHAPLQVFKHSKVHIKINPGAHIGKIGAKGFGISSEFQCDLEQNERAIYKYTGPYWIYSWGDLERLD